MIVMGIDPGQSGGISIFTVSSKTGFVDNVTACKMPETERDVHEVLSFWKPDYVVIEDVHSMPKQGVSSSFKFGRSYGFLRGIVVGLGVPFQQVSPQTWQKTLGCRSGGDKNITKAAAQQKFPKLKITHATADALLIGLYGIPLAKKHYNP